MTSNEESNVSGEDVSILLNVSAFHCTNPFSGGCDFLIFFAFFPDFSAAAAAFASARLFSTTCAGA